MWRVGVIQLDAKVKPIHQGDRKPVLLYSALTYSLGFLLPVKKAKSAPQKSYTSPADAMKNCSQLSTYPSPSPASASPCPVAPPPR